MRTRTDEEKEKGAKVLKEGLPFVTPMGGASSTATAIATGIKRSKTLGDLALRGGLLKGGEVTPWEIGIRNPEIKDEIVESFKIKTGAIATSGSYEKGAHIYDPFTNLIAIGARSATVIGPDAAIADALATALMVSGKDGAIWFSKPELKSYSVFVIERNSEKSWSIDN
jgi:thiamine biosynthesis lipoprotein